jgi:hypothetical protein
LQLRLLRISLDSLQFPRFSGWNLLFGICRYNDLKLRLVGSRNLHFELNVLLTDQQNTVDHWRLGHITKQGSKLLRFLLGQSAQSAARCEERWHRQCAHLSMRRNKLIAKVAMARKLAVSLGKLGA